MRTMEKHLKNTALTGYNESVHVLLIVYVPKMKRVKVKRPVSLSYVFP